MKSIYCIEAKNGILLGSKRLSKDIKVEEDIRQVIGSEDISILENSCSFFSNLENVKVVSDLSKTEINFIESDCFYDPEELVIYNWNRHYPATEFFNIKFLENYVLLDQKDFAGNSHENITRYFYIRKDLYEEK